MSREQKTVKSAPNIGEKQECRACLCKLGSKDVSYKLFDTWTPPMQVTQATIAEELARTANIQLSPKDEHSKVICKCCCDKLQEVCRFTSMVRDNDKILRLRHPKQKSEAAMWPKPISIDKNIFDNSDVKIKEEVLTDDEYSAAMEVGKGFATVDIKVEPEEILPDKIEITVNGTISLNEYKSENPMTNGDDCEVYEQEEHHQPADVAEAFPKGVHVDRSCALGPPSPAIFASSTLHPAPAPPADSPSYLEEVKEEPASDSDDLDTCADLPLDCMLCSKPFKTISGLKAHVIAMHSYKSVRRRADSGASPDRPAPAPAPAPASHVCATCRRSFATPTDLMVHETCHAQAACYGCGAHFATAFELATHAVRCRGRPAPAPAPATPAAPAAPVARHKHKSTPKHKSMADTIRPPAPPGESRKGGSASCSPRACAQCGERFSDGYYLRIHREIHHTGPAQAEPDGGASAMDTSALENIFTGND